MTDILRLLERQNFKTEQEMQAFLDGLMGKPIEGLPKEELSNEELAQELVEEAYELSETKARKKIQEALKLNPNCLEAYEALISIEPTTSKKLQAIKTAIELGRKLFGGEFLKENKGEFWLIHETRPFMRCLHTYANYLYSIGNLQESISLLEELIDLNPSDNQGVRYELFVYLLELNATEKYLKYSKFFKDDASASLLFNNALFTFKKEGEGAKANKALLKAIKDNEFIAKKLLLRKKITRLPDYYGLGDESEADMYLYKALPIWLKTEGAIDWVKRVYKK